MKIAIVGAGGVGGYFGAKLVQGGADVRFIARGAHLAAMRANGLTVEETNGATTRVKVAAGDDPNTVGVVDLVMVSVKLWDTPAVLAAIRPMVGPQTALVSFQNGVLKDDDLRAAYMSEQIMGGVAYVAVTIAQPGVIRKTGALERLVFGEFDGTRSARAHALLKACLEGDIKAELSDDIRGEIWRKFVFLVGLSATTATMRLPIGPIRANARTRAFLRDVMDETVAVGRAHGVDLPEDFADTRMELIDTIPEDMTASMHHDLERGNRLEVRWLSGGVVELGAVKGVPTPLNRAVADILAPHADGKAEAPSG